MRSMLRWVSVTLIVAGTAAIALADPWVNPCSQNSHQTAGTCDILEECIRCCRICCTHFHPDTSTAEWADCNTLCEALPANCPDVEA